jgi:N-acetylglucosamine PTS system EIICBA or EIICB component
MALTAFLTGVTEPIEFSFMFLAPVLYAIHAVLTGLSMVIMNALGVRLGFGFSAGLFDYLINFGKATRPLLLLPVGIVYFALYYAIFTFAIRTFDLNTPGRENDVEAANAAVAASGSRGAQFAAALGGASNLKTVDACTTRLRLILADGAQIDEAALKRLGSRGIVRPSANALQVVLGPIADQVAGEIRSAMHSGETATAQPAAHTDLSDTCALLEALGGSKNVLKVETCSSRLRVSVADASAIDEPQLRAIGARGVAKPKPDSVHVVIGPGAEQVADGLRKALAAP